jgi:hypothetical protein
VSTSKKTFYGTVVIDGVEISRFKEITEEEAYGKD